MSAESAVSSVVTLRRVLGRVVLEFLVIVSGVLVALAADEWRGSLSEARLAETYRARIIRDLESDTALWRSIEEQAKAKIAALDQALRWVRNPSFEPAAVSQLLQDLTIGTRLSYAGGTNANRTTFDELVSTGRVDLIPDAVIRRDLMAYYLRVDNQRTRIVSRNTQYAPTIYELIPRDPEFLVSPALEDSDKLRVARRAQQADLEGLIIAERNLGRLRLEVTDEMFARADSLLQSFRRRS